MKLSPLLFTLVVLSLITPVQAQHLATLSLKGQGLEVYSLVPYDNGVVLLISNATSFYVYFVNSTMQRVLYYHSVNVTGNSTLVYSLYSALTAFYAFAFNGSLYVVKYFSLGGTADIMVFNGLKLVKNVTLNVLTLEPVGGPLYNVSAMKMVCGPFIYTGIVTNYTRFPFYPTALIFNSTNVTVPGLLLAALRLPNGTFMITDYFWPFTSPEKRQLNLLFYDGNEALWNRTFLIYTPNKMTPIYLQSLESFISAHFFTVIGDEILVINETSVKGNEANISVIELNMNNGEIVGEVNIVNAPQELGIFDVGGKPYILTMSNDALIVSELTNGGLIAVAKVPIAIENRTVTYTYEGKNSTTTVRVVLTGVHYVYGDYLIFINPVGNGTNVTVVNPLNVTSYVISGKAEFHSGSLLVNSSNNFSLILLNALGIPVRAVNLGYLPPSYHPSIKVFSEGTKYYVVEETCVDNVTAINMTEVNANNLTQRNAVNSHGISRAHLAVILPLAAAIVIIATLVLRRR